MQRAFGPSLSLAAQNDARNVRKVRAAAEACVEETVARGAGGGSHGDERPRRCSAGARQKEKRAPAHADDSAPATMAMAARPWDWNSAAVAALTLALAAAAARAALRPRGTLV